jgi:predicted TIM-barrel fold metal-dependent hydrolase
MRIEKIDAHHHLWAVSSPNYPMMAAPNARRFYGDTEQLKHDFGMAEFLPLAAGQNVVKSVFVEAGYSPAVAETAHVQAISDQYGFPHAILARIDPAADTVRAELKTHMASPNFRGVRLTLNWDVDETRRSAQSDGLMMAPDWRRGYALLGEQGLSADLMMLPHQMNQAADLAAAFPDVLMIVNHAGLPLDQNEPGMALWREGIKRLAEHAHVAVKISGLGMADPHWSVESIRPIVDQTIDIFGAARCLFASNFPVDGLYSSYDAVFDALDAITKGRTDQERRMLFHDNAARLYRL